ncbi:phosphoribosyl-ATP diphosphatase [Thalassobaculum sp.]|uniref:phosphoribosyl-ATP diphosphatase n=1 Tax=Thalassobaculum sp. TaxID=2022740 RepID=UPI003B5A4FD7
MADHILDRLAATIAARKGADPETSYTAKLLAKGPVKSAQKVGEEAVEVAIEAALGNPDALASESADLLYHLLVLWTAAGVTPDQVWAKLEAREGTSGLAEKAARGQANGEGE